MTLPLFQTPKGESTRSTASARKLKAATLNTKPSRKAAEAKSPLSLFTLAISSEAPETETGNPVVTAPPDQTTQKLETQVSSSIDAPAVKLIAPRARRTTWPRAVTAKPKVVSAAITPLGGSVPTGPVFIPVAQVRQEKSHRTPEPVAAAPAPLTAELLAQRWIQS